MKKRILAALLTLSVGLTLLAGCGGAEAPASSAAASSPESWSQPAEPAPQEDGPRIPGGADSGSSAPQAQSAAPSAPAESAPEAQSVPEAAPAPEEPPADPPVLTVSDGVVTLDRLPADLAEFKALSADLSQPETTAALFLCAAQLYVQDREMGEQAVDLLRGPVPMTGYDRQFLADRLRDKAYLPLAYFEGAAPENNYTPAEPFVLKVLEDPNPQKPETDKGIQRLFIETAGADSSRPLRVRQKDGNWYLYEYSSILSGIRLPAEADPWA